TIGFLNLNLSYILYKCNNIEVAYAYNNNTTPIFLNHYATGSALKPLPLMMAITSSPVIPLEFTVSILSGLSVSTFHSEIPAELSKSDLTFDTHPPQLRVVLNLRSLFSIILIFRMI